jgi:uncharacterized protein DUF1570
VDFPQIGRFSGDRPNFPVALLVVACDNNCVGAIPHREVFMKRLLALAALLAICASPVTADYLFIKIDLKKFDFAASAAKQGAGQQGFGQPAFGQPNAQGGQGGQQQNQQKMQQQMQMQGKGGGFKGGFGKGGPMPQQGPMQGQPQAGAGPQVGPQGGPMGGPLGGAMGSQMYSGQMSMQGGGDSDVSSHIIWTVIELKSQPKTLQNGQGGTVVEVDHRFGHKGRFPIVPEIITYIGPVKSESLTTQFKKRYGKDIAEGKEADRLVAAAFWALNHGMTKNFHDALNALAKADPKNAALQSYERMDAALKVPASTEDRATHNFVNDLKGESFRIVDSEGGHYSIVTKMTGAQADALVKRRLNRLEDMYKNFFYWFALQPELPQPAPPKQRLYVMLVDSKNDFQKYHDFWGNQPTCTDGFTPRRDNLIVLAATRLDENYQVFEKNAQELFSRRKLSKEELILGTVWDRAEAKNNVSEVAAVQTLTLMQKAMEEESEKASITHEATRQLLFATGMLPRFVNVPEWVQSGIGSYFDTPYCALYSGIGLPNWTNLVSFKHYRKQKDRLGKSPHEAYDALISTITDRFFRESIRADADARDASEKEREKKDEKAKEAQEVARSTAWSLVYYLMDTKKLPQLLKYMEELNNLPRDLEFTDEALQGCFARAFNLTDPKDARRLNKEAAERFALGWFSHMREINLEVPLAEEEFVKLRYPVRRQPAAANSQFGLPQGQGFVPQGGGIPPMGLPMGLPPANP